jgi:hypothetical protein
LVKELGGQPELQALPLQLEPLLLELVQPQVLALEPQHIELVLQPVHCRSG